MPYSSSSSSSSCCAYICCSSTEPLGEENKEVNKTCWEDFEAGNVSDAPKVETPEVAAKRKRAEAWDFNPDCTPIPELESRIRAFYKKDHLRVYKTTIGKLMA